MRFVAAKRAEVKAACKANVLPYNAGVVNGSETRTSTIKVCRLDKLDQGNGKWRTECYSASELPEELDLILAVLGERLETRARRSISK